MTRLSRMGVLGFLVAALGCADGAPTFVTLKDGEAGLNLNFLPGPMGDDVHQPYGVGAQVRLTAMHANPSQDHSGWFAEFEGGSNAHVASQSASKESLSITASMDGAGPSKLVIWDSTSRRHRVRSQTLNAVVPDDADLFAAAQVMTDADWQKHPAQAPLDLTVHGDTQFNVRMMSGGKEVYGVPLAVTSSDGAVSVDTAPAFLAAGDVMDVHAHTTGEVDLVLTANGQTLKTVRVISHAVSDLVGVDVLKAPVDAKANDGDLEQVVAQGRLADGRPAWGVPMTWTTGGQALRGTADVLQYKFRKGANITVVATLENLQATVQVEGDPSAVTSSASGCAQSGTSTWGIVALLLLALRRVRR